MSRLTAAERRQIPTDEFGVPSKAPGPGSYPMPDAKHASLAKGFAKRFASSGEQKQIAGKAKKVKHRAKRQVRSMGAY